MARGPDLVEWEPRPQTGIPDKKNGADATQQQQWRVTLALSQAPPNAAMEVWQTASDQGDFNSCTLCFGEDKGLVIDQRLDLTRSSGPEIHKQLRSKESNFKVVAYVPVKFYADDSIAESANLLKEYQTITIGDCKCAGHTYAVPIAIGLLDWE